MAINFQKVEYILQLKLEVLKLTLIISKVFLLILLPKPLVYMIMPKSQTPKTKQEHFCRLFNLFNQKDQVQQEKVDNKLYNKSLFLSKKEHLKLGL